MNLVEIFHAAENFNCATLPLIVSPVHCFYFQNEIKYSFRYCDQENIMLDIMKINSFQGDLTNTLCNITSGLTKPLVM